MHKASLLFIFERWSGLESSMSTLRSVPRSFYVVADLHPPAPSRFIADENKKVFMLFNTNTKVRGNTRPEPPPLGEWPLCSVCVAHMYRNFSLRTVIRRQNSLVSYVSAIRQILRDLGQLYLAILTISLNCTIPDIISTSYI